MKDTPPPLLHRFIASNPVLSALDENQRAHLAQLAIVRTVRRGEVLVTAGRPSCGLYLLLRGELKSILLSPAGAEKVVSLLGAGSLFGEDALLANHPEMMCVQAVAEADVAIFPVAAVRELLRHSGAFALAVGQHLACRLQAVLENLQVCSQRDSTQRVAHYLSSLVPANAEHCELELSTDKQTIAKQLNLTPETFSRVLARLSRDGLCRTRGRRGIAIHDVAGLRAFAGP